LSTYSKEYVKQTQALTHATVSLIKLTKPVRCTDVC
jgi:hypothetical protein